MNRLTPIKGGGIAQRYEPSVKPEINIKRFLTL